MNQKDLIAYISIEMVFTIIGSFLNIGLIILGIVSFLCTLGYYIANGEIESPEHHIKTKIGLKQSKYVSNKKLTIDEIQQIAIKNKTIEVPFSYIEEHIKKGNGKVVPVYWHAKDE